MNQRVAVRALIVKQQEPTGEHLRLVAGLFRSDVEARQGACRSVGNKKAGRALI